jgi:integrase
MAKDLDPRLGDKSGDNRTRTSAVSSRPKKTKPPATAPGIERRWIARRGWMFRARIMVSGILTIGAWTTREQAIRDHAAMRERREASEGVIFVSLEQACQDVLDTVRDNAGTWRSYHEHFLVLCEFFGADETLQAITPARIQQFLTARRAARVRGKPPSELRLRKHIGALGRVFRLAIRNGHFAGANPIDRIERPRAGKRRHPGVYTVDELGEAFAALRAHPGADWDAAVVAALLFTGLRREGLCHVTTAMIDRKGGFIRGIEQKKSVDGFVPLTKPLAHVLPSLEAGADPDGHLVPAGTARGPRRPGGRPRSDTERRVEAVNRVFARCRSLLPVQLRSRFRPHAMRHSLRTILGDARVPEHIRDAITDHAPSTVGRGYEHASPAAVRAWAGKALDPLLWLVDPTAEHQQQAAQG